MLNAKILLDSPSDTPALGFNEIALALKQIIEESKPQFVIGIFGPWGSGKTTLMRAIERNLDKKTSIAIQFSAWRYEKEPNLVVPLLDVVRESLVDWSNENAPLRENAMATASTIGKAIYSLLAGFSVKAGVPQALEVSFDANRALTQASNFDEKDKDAKVPRSFYHAAFRTLSDSFTQFLGASETPSRIVIFVDDLDRCLPHGALEVLEAMKLFFDLDGFIFVVGLDRQVIERAIDLRYADTSKTEASKIEKRISGADYVKKIFQVPFAIAPIAVGDLDGFLNVINQDAALPPEQAQEFSTVVVPHLRYIVADGTVNPREVKRYLNAYTLGRKIKPNLDKTVMLALQTIAFRADWADVNQAILSHRETFLEAVNRCVSQMDPSAITDLDPTLPAIPESFLNYVSGASPGAPLLTLAAGLDDYIYSGEQTRSSGNNPMFLNAIRDAAVLAGELRQLKAAPDSSKIPTYTSRATSLQGTLSAAGPLFNTLIQEWKQHSSPGSAAPPVVTEADDSLKRWLLEEEAIARRLQALLMDNYRLQSINSQNSL